MAQLGRGAYGVALRTGSIYTGVGGQLHELCAGSTGQVLTVLWDGTLGYTDPVGPGPETLNDLLDVNAPQPKCGETLIFTGNEWKPVTLKQPAFEYFMAQI